MIKPPTCKNSTKELKSTASFNKKKILDSIQKKILAKKMKEIGYSVVSLNSEKFIHFESQTIGKTFNYYKKMSQLFKSKMYYHINYNNINSLQKMVFYILNICRKIELLFEIPIRKILKK